MTYFATEHTQHLNNAVCWAKCGVIHAHTCLFLSAEISQKSHKVFRVRISKFTHCTHNLVLLQRDGDSHPVFVSIRLHTFLFQSKHTRGCSEADRNNPFRGPSTVVCGTPMF